MPKSRSKSKPQSNDRAQGSIAAHLLRLTIPMFFGISAMIVASMVDIIYIGWLGTEELAAISFTFPLVIALSSVSMGIGIGASSIIARDVGGATWTEFDNWPAMQCCSLRY